MTLTREQFKDNDDFLRELNSRISQYGAESPQVDEMLELAVRVPEWQDIARTALDMRRMWEEAAPDANNPNSASASINGLLHVWANTQDYFVTQWQPILLGAVLGMLLLATLAMLSDRYWFAHTLATAVGEQLPDAIDRADRLREIRRDLQAIEHWLKEQPSGKQWRGDLITFESVLRSLIEKQAEMEKTLKQGERQHNQTHEVFEKQLLPQVGEVANAAKELRGLMELSKQFSSVSQSLQQAQSEVVRQLQRHDAEKIALAVSARLEPRFKAVEPAPHLERVEDHLKRELRLAIAAAPRLDNLATHLSMNEWLRQAVFENATRRRHDVLFHDERVGPSASATPKIIVVESNPGAPSPKEKLKVWFMDEWGSEGKVTWRVIDGRQRLSTEDWKPLRDSVLALESQNTPPLAGDTLLAARRLYLQALTTLARSPDDKPKNKTQPSPSSNNPPAANSPVP